MSRATNLSELTLLVGGLLGVADYLLGVCSLISPESGG